MSARIHSAVLHRFAVPAWLLAVILAAAIAASLVAALDSPRHPGAGAQLRAEHLRRLDARGPLLTVSARRRR